MNDMQALIRACAVRLIAHHNAGRVVDPLSLKWARDLLKMNPTTERESTTA